MWGESASAKAVRGTLNVMARPFLRRENVVPLALSAVVVGLVAMTRRRKLVPAAVVPGEPPVQGGGTAPQQLRQLVLTRDTPAYTAPPTRSGTAIETVTAGTLLGLLGENPPVGSYSEVTYPYPAEGRQVKRGWIDMNAIRATSPLPEGEGTVDYVITGPAAALTARYHAAVTSPLRVDGVEANDTLESELRGAGMKDAADQLRSRRDQLFRLVASNAVAAARRASTIAEAGALTSEAKILADRGYASLRDEVINAIGARQAELGR